MKKICTYIFLQVLATTSFAQDATISPDKSSIGNFPKILEEPIFYFWVGMATVFIFVFYTLSHAIHVLARKQELIPAVDAAAEKVKRRKLWSKMMIMLTRSVPVAEEKDVLLDHDYDGIKELDNKLPPWWVWGFYLTILFAFVYMAYYHVSGSGKLMVAEYKAEMDNAALQLEERKRNNANFVTDENVVRLTESTSLTEGASIYQKNCLACHGDKGQGNVGPNLTDDYWLHGGGIKNVFHTITEGVPSKGMISWKTQLSPKQIQEVASFILSIRGSHPEGAKEPQGDLYEETEVLTNAAPIDSSKAASQKISPL